MESPGIVPNNPYPSSGMATINAPEYNRAGTQLKLEAKSVKDAGQAWNICKALEFNNRQRNLRTASIQSLYDGQPPFSQGDNMEKAAGWRANASTLWLAGIVDRVGQRLLNAIISQTYCTASALPDGYEDAKTKTDFLRAKFTQLVRGWDGNTQLLNNIVHEDVLQGYCYSVFLDPITHHPTFFRQDTLFVPEKTLSHARDVQFFAIRQDYRLDRFIDLFRDEKAAEDNGYNVTNCLAAANAATMQDPRDDAATTQFRKFEDMIDEGTQGLSYGGTGERIVKTWLLFNREYDGQVSFWMLQRDTGKLLRFSFKLFPRMQDVLTMFSFEAGNGCIHSSKGLGRKLAALSIMKELFRCGIIDNSRMAGLMVIRVDPKDKVKFQPAIMSPFILLDKSVDVSEAQFQTSAESYKVVDTMIDGWAEQAVGAYLAAQITEQGRTERTATEATIDARRESEASDIMIRRTLDQNATMIQMQQYRVCTEKNIREARRIYKKITSDPEVDLEKVYPTDIDENNLMRFLVECMEFGLTDEEIMVWSKSQASAFAHVTESAVTRGVGVVKQTMSGNPNIDQQALDYAYLESLVGADMAKKLFVPGGPDTGAIEAERKQQMESGYMAITGQAVAVSPRDNHLGEAPVIVVALKALTPALESMSTTDKDIKTIELNLNHLGAHLEAATALGQNKSPEFKAIDDFYRKFKADFEKVVQVRTEAQVAQQMVTQGLRNPENVGPVGLPGSGPVPPSPISLSDDPGAITPIGLGEPAEPALAPV
jgi:hypothetical protein